MRHNKLRKREARLPQQSAEPPRYLLSPPTRVNSFTLDQRRVSLTHHGFLSRWQRKRHNPERADIIIKEFTYANKQKQNRGRRKPARSDQVAGERAIVKGVWLSLRLQELWEGRARQEFRKI